MNTVNTYIDSGIIENYCLGNLSTAEAAEVADMASMHPEIKAEIDRTLTVLEQIPQSPEPRTALKDQILGFLDQYLEPGMIDLQNPPLIHLHSNTIAWNLALNNLEPDIHEPGFATRVLKETAHIELSVVWLSDKLVEEAHDEGEFIESILILEGACECDFGGKIVRFSEGDYFDVPPNTPHAIKNISEGIPFVKGLVQRRKAA